MKTLKRITWLSILLGVVMFGLSQARAALASDDASDVVYNDGWTTGDNGGSGFGAWTLSGAVTATRFISTGENNGAGNVDVASESFGLHADYFDISSAARTLTTPMSAGQTFIARIDTGTVQAIGEVGFSLNIGGTAMMRIFYVGAGSFYQVVDAGAYTTSVPVGSDVTVAIEVTGANTYNINLNGGAYVNSSTFASSGAIDTVNFYNNFAGPLAANDFYFNSMEVVPEPAVTSGLACLVLVGAVVVRQVRRAGLRA